MTQEDWEDQELHSLGTLYAAEGAEGGLLLLSNASKEAFFFHFPKEISDRRWNLLLDTLRPQVGKISKETFPYALGPHALALFQNVK